MSEGEEKELQEANEVAVKGDGAQVQSHIPHYDSITKQREQIREAAISKNPVPLTRPVKIIVVLVILAAAVVIACVTYSLNLNKTHDANLQKTMMHGSIEERIIAVKDHIIEANSATYHTIIAVFILVVLVVFGYMLYHSNASRHQEERTHQVLAKAEDTVNFQVGIISGLTTDRKLAMAEVSRLQTDVHKCEEQIDDYKKNEKENKQKIQALEQQKAKKEAELAAAKVKLDSAQENLKEAKQKEEMLKDNIEVRKQLNTKLEQENKVCQERIHRLQADMEREREQVW